MGGVLFYFIFWEGFGNWNWYFCSTSSHLFNNADDFYFFSFYLSCARDLAVILLIKTISFKNMALITPSICRAGFGTDPAALSNERRASQGSQLWTSRCESSCNAIHRVSPQLLFVIADLRKSGSPHPLIHGLNNKAWWVTALGVLSSWKALWVFCEDPVGGGCSFQIADGE